MAIPDVIEDLLGLSLGPDDLDFSHMAWRAGIVFVWAIFIARVADRRFLGANAIFDVMLSVLFASLLSRAVNGGAAFFPSLGASFVLVLLHRILGMLAYRSHRISQLLKGRQQVLVRDGKVDEAAMRRNRITAADLEENLRLFGNVVDPAAVAEARLERNGRISVLLRESSPTSESPGHSARSAD
jgi:uncharacterized membrane protein YcaP (DUF421 family)